MTNRASSTPNIAWSSYNYPIDISASDATGSEEVQLSYGPDRQRWKQIYTGPGGTETTYYIGGLMDEVFSGGIANYRHYIYAGGEAIAVYSRSGSGANTLSYMLEDHQGGVANIASSAGVSAVSESFSAFGLRRNPATWSGAPSTSDLNTIASLSRQGYTFQTWLGQSMGLNHMNGRVEDAILGRFLSPDPIIQDPSNAQNYNRYSYVYNNPLTYIDPSGFCGTNSEESELANCSDSGGGNFAGIQEIQVTGSASCTVLANCISYAPPDSFSPQGAPASAGAIPEIVVIAPKTPKVVIPPIDIPPIIVPYPDVPLPGPLSFPSPAQSQTKPTSTTCIGLGRGLAGNTNLNGRQGGVPGQTIQSNTAAVIPQQFGFPSGVGLAPFAANIFGTIGQANFSSITDVIGGQSPIPGLNVRSALQQLNPGQLIIEIPGATDQGSNAPVTIVVPPGVSCPVGTSPAAGGSSGGQ